MSKFDKVGNIIAYNLDFDYIPDKITLSGVTKNNRQDIIPKLKENMKVIFLRDPFNQYDRYAIKVITTLNNEEIQIGWIPKEYAEILAPEIDAGINWKGKINKILGGTKYKENYGVLINIYYNE